MFKTAKLGNEVYSMKYGKGIIIGIDSYKDFKLLVEFDTTVERFTESGKERTTDDMPTLFWTIPEIKKQHSPRRVPRNTSYYYVDSGMKISEASDCRLPYQDSHYESGNYFKKQEDAEKFLDYCRVYLIQHMEDRLDG